MPRLNIYRFVSLIISLTAILSSLTIIPANAAAVNYAFGDSRASGYGLSPLPTATSEDTACGRSTQAYSALAAAQAGATNRLFACQGSTLYGVYDQINTAAKYGSPNYVTLTDGANDTNWGTWFNQCKSQADCGGPQTEADFQKSLATYKNNLQYILNMITTNLRPGQILVVGYGPLFANDRSCGAAYGITSSEAATIDRRVATIDQTMADVVATVPTATYVPISFSGKGICTKDGPIKPLSSPDFAHPTVQGQQVIAEAVLAKVK